MLVLSSQIKTAIPHNIVSGLLKLARKYGTIRYEKKGNYYLYPENELRNFVKKLEAVVLGKNNTK
ncbi:hypothetical protein [Thermosipho globiformans]|uniref:hypothetical protein n=1 Tax=Thermosipho globiformans TaxID=380685 RepID=UPI000F8DFDD1|nr:hypothetical protein [Thermosipho globiformans]